MKIKISREDIINKLIIVDIVCCLYVELLISYSSVFAILSFIPDVCNMIIVILIIYHNFVFDEGMILSKTKLSDWMGICFIIYTLLSILWSNFDIGIAFKRYRYIFAVFLIYYCCKRFITQEYYEKIINIFYWSAIINFILVVYQGGILDVGPDFSNGIFGFTNWNNAAEGIFCIILSILAILFYFDEKKRHKGKFLVVFMALSCMACAVAEIKAFYILLVVGAMLAIVPHLKYKRRIKSIARILLMGIGLLVIAFLILAMVLPDNLYTFFDLGGYINYETYGAQGGAGRLNQISYILEHDYGNNLLCALWGKGLGVDSTVYVYELGKSFLNFGFVGLFFLIMFFISNAVECYAIAKRYKQAEAYASFVLSILMILVIMIWNCTLNRTGYIVFYFLAIGQAIGKEKSDESIIMI